jgi:hypothetical protein
MGNCASFYGGASVSASNGRSNSNDENNISERKDQLKKEILELRRSRIIDKGNNYYTPDDAARNILSIVTPLSHKYQLEIGGNIFYSKGFWHYTNPKVGESDKMEIGAYWIGYHTHPSGSLNFSNRFNNSSNHFEAGDAFWVSNNQKDLYLGVLIDGEVKIGVCEPGNCKNVSNDLTPPSRIVK